MGRTYLSKGSSRQSKYSNSWLEDSNYKIKIYTSSPKFVTIYVSKNKLAKMYPKIRNMIPFPNINNAESTETNPIILDKYFLLINKYYDLTYLIIYGSISG